MTVVDILPERLFAPRRAERSLLGLCAAGVLAATLLLALTIALFGHPSDGQPFAVINLAQQSISVAPPQSSFQRAVSPKALSVATYRTKVFAGNALIADPALIEQTPAGPLPRIADDGRTPMQAYSPPVAATSKPRIAIVVTGLGLSAKSTDALLGLPPGVTLAITSFAPDAQHWLTEARRRGHEVLLSLPMEPFDYPDSDPGPDTLRTGVPEDDNARALASSLTRLVGYAGVANLLGDRFLADAPSLSPVLNVIASRGLMFFESEPGSRSAAAETAARLKVSYVKAFGSVDASLDPSSIDRSLSELESRARQEGAAAATASAQPITLAHITNWSRSLAARGFVLAPASAIVRSAK